MGTQTYQCVTLMADWIPQDIETMIRRCLGDHFPQVTTTPPPVFSSCFSSSLTSYPYSLIPRYSTIKWASNTLIRKISGRQRVCLKQVPWPEVYSRSQYPALRVRMLQAAEPTKEDHNGPVRGCLSTKQSKVTKQAPEECLNLSSHGTAEE